MKKQLTVVLVLLLTTAIALLIMSCAPAQNTNQNTNASANTNANSTKAVEKIKDCSEIGITTEMNQIIKDAGVENQHTGNGNQYGTKNFNFKPVKMGTEWVLLIEGGISDGKKNEPDTNAEHMEKFIKAVDQIITKTCVTRAMFVNRGAIQKLEAGAVALGDVPGFDWSTCDWPNIACPNGLCAEKCPDKTVPSGTPGSNSNANSNSQSNAGSNANANRNP